MANEVWEFKRYSNGKTELVGRMPHKDVDPAKMPGATHAVEHNGHTLDVRITDGFVIKCRTCDKTGLINGQICGVIDEYNDEKHPL